ncbi:MAG: response regulator transcription factor [Bacteroidia bacterium]
MKQKIKILLAEDDPNLGLLLVDLLEREGYAVTLCKDGEEALFEYENKSFDLCLLDVMMPKKDGFEFAKSIRESNALIPILFITAKSLKEDRLKGYGLGADDYITKPFDEEELLCKIQVIIRRIIKTEASDETKTTFVGKYIFDFSNQSLLMDGKMKRMTEKESRVLKILSDKRNRVVKREELLKSIWGENDYFMGRSLDVFITKIRKYLKDDTTLSIENVFGVGFILNDDSK